jgi:hypothetical protein
MTNAKRRKHPPRTTSDRSQWRSAGHPGGAVDETRISASL